MIRRRKRFKIIYYIMYVLDTNKMIPTTKPKIAIVHNFMGPYGGAEQSTYITYKLLKENGYEVEVFSSKYEPMFEDFKYKELFADYQDYDALKSIPDKLVNIHKPFYNKANEHKFATFLDLFKPDIVHFGTISWHLSPSVIKPCLDRNIPTVMTLREGRIVCPSGTLMRGGHTYCENLNCSTISSTEAIKHRCYEGSLLKSTMVAAEFKFRKMHKLFQRIDKYITPSQAFSDLVVKTGVSQEHVYVVNNFIDNNWLNKPVPTDAGASFLYAGRLSKEKGVHYVLEALASLPEQIELKIVGTGPAEDALKQQTESLGIKHRVHFLGHMDPTALQDAYANAKANLLPCNWFENFGRTIIESHAMGRPVIGSNIGGIPENVIQNKTGLLVEPGNVEQIREAMLYIYNNPEHAMEMGRYAQERANTLFNRDKHFKDLIAVYDLLEVKA